MEIKRNTVGEGGFDYSKFDGRAKVELRDHDSFLPEVMVADDGLLSKAEEKASEFKVRGERWHEMAEKENPVLAFFVLALSFALVFSVIFLFGGEASAENSPGGQEKDEFVIVEDAQGVDDGGEPGYSGEPVPVPEEVPGDNAEEPKQEAVYDYAEEAWEDYEAYVEPVWDYTPLGEASYSGGEETGNLQFNGVEYSGGVRYTWYSQQVLPGGGLDIPGRHVDSEGYVRDGDDNLVLASSDLEYGTEVETPYGTGVVRDTGCPSGTLDVYTNWPN